MVVGRILGGHRWSRRDAAGAARLAWRATWRAGLALGAVWFVGGAAWGTFSDAVAKYRADVALSTTPGAVLRVSSNAVATVPSPATSPAWAYGECATVRDDLVEVLGEAPSGVLVRVVREGDGRPGGVARCAAGTEAFVPPGTAIEWTAGVVPSVVGARLREDIRAVAGRSGGGR